MAKKIIYEDDANDVIFFDLKDYLKELSKDILKQDRQRSYYIQRNVSIHPPYESDELHKLFKQKPNCKTLYKLVTSRSEGYSVRSHTRYALKKTDFDKEEIGKIKLQAWDRIKIVKMKVLGLKVKKKPMYECTNTQAAVNGKSAGDMCNIMAGGQGDKDICLETKTCKFKKRIKEEK